MLHQHSQPQPATSMRRVLLLTAQCAASARMAPHARSSCCCSSLSSAAHQHSTTRTTVLSAAASGGATPLRARSYGVLSATQQRHSQLYRDVGGSSSTISSIAAAAPPPLPLLPQHQSYHHDSSKLRLLSPLRAMPEGDLDSYLITRRSLSALTPPTSSPLGEGGRSKKDNKDTTNSSSSSSSSGSPLSSLDSTDSGSVSAAEWEDVLAHKKAAVQQAYINGTLGFGFSAGGLVFPYYVGLVSSLVQQGVLTRPSQLAGSSAGSLIAASFNSGLDMATVERSMIEFGENCLKNGTRYRLGPLLREFLDSYLPPNAHELCSGTTHVAVTRLLPYWRTQMVSHFESREDLVHALLTSCHIPWYFDGRWMTKFRGHYCVDGGVMAFIPTVPEAEYTVKVMCFPSSHLSLIKGATANRAPLKRLHNLVDIDITMDSFEEWPYDLQQVLKWALLASAEETSSLLIEKGKRDAAAWVTAMELQPLVAAKQQQQQADDGDSAGNRPQQQQQEGEREIIVGPAANFSGASPAPAPTVSSSSVGWDWGEDHKSTEQRQQEADRAVAAADAVQQEQQQGVEEDRTQGSSRVYDAGGGGGGEGASPLYPDDAASAAAAAMASTSGGGDGDGGVDDGEVSSRVAAAEKHAAELEAAGVGAGGLPNKRHKAAAAAATVAATAHAAAEGVGSLLGGCGGKRAE